MTTSRLSQLIQYYKDDPDDPFNVYALALEYLKSDLTKSRELFDVLLYQHENYVPAYYHAAKLFVDLGERDTATRVLERGMAVAKKQNDVKAAQELRSFLDELTFE
jgi:hypothetical protein